MSYLVWNIDIEAIRRICMDSAFFQNNWQFSETSDDLLERLEIESPDARITCYDNLVEAIENSDRCERLASMANSNLSVVYNGYNHACVHRQDITPREIIDYMYDLQALEQFF